MSLSRRRERLRIRRLVRRSETELDHRRSRVRRRAGLRRGGLVLAVVVVAVLGVLLPWLIWRGPYVLDAKYLDRSKLSDGSAALVTGLRTALVGLVAALGAGVALLYTARTYRLTRRGQITDRFTKALERLGSTDVYVRVGGVLALEQIVRDAPDQAAADAARVLGHFIRERAPRARAEGPGPEPLPDQPDADVQAALTAVTRPRFRKYLHTYEELNLRGVHLAGADLRRSDLTDGALGGVNLAGANLTGATLTTADLRRATLTGAVLSGGELMWALLDDADLSGARLAGAMLLGATLRHARLDGADLRDATLVDAQLEGASMVRANLRGTMLHRADLTGATLTGAGAHEARGLTPGQFESVGTDEVVFWW
ncbi:pentapeptide repeat-containing protein [Streptomyces sp. NPDC088785]|uniref:pentapeptide repeat-containing protein n=1 Tax=Streptomyces sp. NPDC088785 TaxID=3365897 RepID=UPI00382637BD